MDYERQWLVDMLRNIGRRQDAEDEDFASRHGIMSRNDLINLMGGSP